MTLTEDICKSCGKTIWHCSCRSEELLVSEIPGSIPGMLSINMVKTLRNRTIYMREHRYAATLYIKCRQWLGTWGRVR